MNNKAILSYKKKRITEIHPSRLQQNKLKANQADKTKWIHYKSNLGLNKKVKSIFQDLPVNNKT